MKGNTLKLLRIRISSFSKIEFVDFSESEKGIVKSTKLRSNFRKANITFSDGVVCGNVYLDCSSWIWKSECEEGGVYSNKIRSLTVHIKSSGKCPECGREFKEVSCKFCPFYGSLLERMKE